MGYTHYWDAKKATRSQFSVFAAACKKLKLNLPRYSESAGGGYGESSKNWKRVIRIRGGLGTGKPCFNSKEVWFNGDEKRNLEHATFSMRPNNTNEWNFCKTARKPYDLLAAACLLAAHQILGYKISSDGGIEDMVEVAAFYNKVLEPEQPITFQWLLDTFGDYQDRYQTENDLLILSEVVTDEALEPGNLKESEAGEPEAIEEVDPPLEAQDASGLNSALSIALIVIAVASVFMLVI